MFKTVSLMDSTWQEIVRQLTVAVGSDDRSRVLAAMITEQTSGAVTVRATKGSVSFKASKGGDLRGMLGIPK